MKAIFFDLDETLHNRSKSVEYFINDQYDRLLKSKYTHFTREDYFKCFREFEKNGYVWKDIVYQRLVDTYSLSIQAEELLEDYLMNFSQWCVSMDGTDELLSSLKQHYKLGLITNGFTDFQKKTIKTLDIGHYFDAIVISEEAGYKKPDPAIFELALNQLGVEPSEACYVGDHVENDMISAKKLGMKTIWVQPQIQEHPAVDLCVDQLLDILPFVTGTKK